MDAGSFLFCFFFFFLVSLLLPITFREWRHSFFLSDVTESPSLVSSASSFNLRPTNTVGSPLFTWNSITSPAAKRKRFFFNLPSASHLTGEVGDVEKCVCVQCGRRQKHYQGGSLFIAPPRLKLGWFFFTWDIVPGAMHL